MRRNHHNLPAFTLLELVMVLFILALMAGLAAPALRGFVMGRRVSDAATEFVALARWARSQAITDAVTYQLNLDTSAGTFWVSLDAANVAAAPAGQNSPLLGRMFHIPDGCRVETDIPTTNGPAVVHFYSDGRTEPGTVRFIDGTTIIEVTCPSATEGYRIPAKESP